MPLDWKTKIEGASLPRALPRCPLQTKGIGPGLEISCPKEKAEVDRRMPQIRGCRAGPPATLKADSEAEPQWCWAGSLSAPPPPSHAVHSGGPPSPSRHPAHLQCPLALVFLTASATRLFSYKYLVLTCLRLNVMLMERR